MSLTKTAALVGLGLGLLLSQWIRPGDAEAQIIPSGSCSTTRACSALSLTSAGAVTGVNYVATIADGGTAFSCSGTTGACVFNSTTSQATATSSVPAFDFKPAFLAADDLVVRFKQGDGGTALTVDTEGDVVCKGGINVSGTTAFTVTGGSDPWVLTRATNDLNMKIGANIYQQWTWASGQSSFPYGINVASNGSATVGVSAGTGSGFDAYKATTNGARWHYGTGSTDYSSSDGTTVTFAGPISSAATQTKGTITLSSGTGTATVIAGVTCVCSDTSATPLVVRCTVASTTLTATEVSGTNVVAYICL